MGLAVFGLTAPAAADEEKAVSWASDTVCVQTTVDKSWGVKNAVKVWNKLDGPRFEIRKSCDSDEARVKVRIKSNKTEFTGVTDWNYDGDNNLTDAVITLNPRYVRTGFKSSDERCIKLHTSAHEFGHALGLPHYPKKHSGSVMSYLGWKKSCGQLSAHDKKDFAKLYG